MFFALVFGAAFGPCRRSGTDRRSAPRGGLRGRMQVIDWAMWLAPFGVACLVFADDVAAGRRSARHARLVRGHRPAGLCPSAGRGLSAAAGVVGRRNPWEFFRDVQRCHAHGLCHVELERHACPCPFAWPRSSSRLPPAVSRFVLTVGATGNQNGTALYEGSSCCFSPRCSPSTCPGQQVTVVLMSVLAGVGTAGVPGGSIPMIVLVLQSIGVPGESIAIILGIDRILDMCRTVLNVTGDLALATCVGRAK